MDPEIESQLKGLQSRPAIERKVREVLHGYGGVRDLRLLPDGRGGLFCFIEPANSAHRMKLFHALDGLFYGDGLMFKIP